MTRQLGLWVRKDGCRWELYSRVPWDEDAGDSVWDEARNAAGLGWHELVILWPATAETPVTLTFCRLMPGLVTLARPRWDGGLPEDVRS
jgi:hypothetical protein